LKALFNFLKAIMGLAAACPAVNKSKAHKFFPPNSLAWGKSPSMKAHK